MARVEGQRIADVLIAETAVPIGVAARALGVSRGAIYAAVQKDEIEAVRLGGRISIPTATLRKRLRIDP
jgi:excisionase family DNA binding protein